MTFTLRKSPEMNGRRHANPKSGPATSNAVTIRPTDKVGVVFETRRAGAPGVVPIVASLLGRAHCKESSAVAWVAEVLGNYQP
jgi:hypothetical protein